MKLVPLYTLFFLLFIGCIDNKTCKLDYSILSKNDSIIGAKNPSFEFDSSEHWREYMLKLNEPNLKLAKVESYRLTLYDSMYETSTIYRVIKDGELYYLIVKEFKFNKAGSKKYLSKNSQYCIPKKDWLELNTLIKNINFWSSPIYGQRMLDSRVWILEGSKPDLNNCTKRPYHIIKRWKFNSNIMSVYNKMLDIENNN